MNIQAANLDDANSWSAVFHDFIATCLTKKVEDRPKAEALMQVCAKTIWLDLALIWSLAFLGH